MHVDSHGGGCNALAIPMETFLLFVPSSQLDGSNPHLISVKNSDPAFDEVVIDASNIKPLTGYCV